MAPAFRRAGSTHTRPTSFTLLSGALSGAGRPAEGRSKREKGRRYMDYEKLIERLSRLKVETGSLACMGCGYEHNCGVHGCRIIREAAEAIKTLQAELAAALVQMRDLDLDCLACDHVKHPVACEDTDFLCDCCPFTCPCKDCDDGSNWSWHGMKARDDDGST